MENWRRICVLVVCAALVNSVTCLKCYECVHTSVSATDPEVDAALKKTMNFNANDVACMLGADTFEENVPGEVECDWDVIQTQVLLSVRAGELTVEEGQVPLEVAYPGNRDNEYEFRCIKQRLDVTWAFGSFDITVDVRTRSCEAVHIADNVPNMCTYEMDAWFGERFEAAVEQTHSTYELDGELCFCKGSLCNGGVMVEASKLVFWGLLVVVSMLYML